MRRLLVAALGPLATLAALAAPAPAVRIAEPEADELLYGPTRVWIETSPQAARVEVLLWP